jgi:hypothetical protein
MSALAKFEAFCKSDAANRTELEVVDWHSLSIGFFIAHGLSVDTAIELANEARYTHQYWTSP